MSHTEKQDVTYYSGHVIEVNGKLYAPERTCHVEKYPPKSELYFETCSVCGCILSAKWPGDRHSMTANYCPSCGNRVVDDAD